MIRFSFLDKTQKDRWLPVLFDLLYENMQSIAPGGQSYEKERDEWLHAVSPALDKAPRQIILCIDENDLLGYFQYYTRDELLMIEEIQLQRQWQSTLLFYRMCKHLITILPNDLKRVEAYADKRNLPSIALMEKLGMKSCEDMSDSPFVHMGGQLDNIRFWRCR